MSENSQKAVYLSDLIGNDYQKWKNDELVMIKAPTGCGKSYFILHKLLDNIVRCEIEFKTRYGLPGIGNAYTSKILYLVNRKILKEQILKECNQIASQFSMEYQKSINISDYISIFTYQELEYQLKYGNSDPLGFFEKYSIGKPIKKLEINPFEYAVYDECHYFYTDSDFNPATEESYLYLMNNLCDTIQIFMSATIENVSKKIEDTWKRYYGHNTKEIKYYEIPINYDYVDLHYFADDKDAKQIVELINAGKNEKWLIFTDSINTGNLIAKKLLQSNDNMFDENQIVCINAGYKQDENGNESVKELVEKDYIGKPVVIATAVLDNGVSFKDIELRNLIIMADSQDEFIQMLGRKRVNGERVKVYICKRNKAYFSRRLQYVNSILEYYKKYANGINDMWNANSNIFYQQVVLDALFSKENIYKKIKRFCYAKNGYIKISDFSERKLLNLQYFYNQMVSAIECDENAFLKVQAQWLGFSKEKIQKFINSETGSISEDKKIKLMNALEKILDGKDEVTILKPENLAYFKEDEEVRALFEHFYGQFEECDEKTKNIKMRALGQNEHPIQPYMFNTIMSLTKLKYGMQSGGKGKYIIKRLQ